MIDAMLSETDRGERAECPRKMSVARVEELLGRVASGDCAARDELIDVTFERLTDLAHRMLRAYPAVRRWEQTGDVVNQASVRLLDALEAVEVRNELNFYRLAAVQIRRELIDLAPQVFSTPRAGRQS